MVTVTQTGDIATSGVAAHGVLAQSIGGGGGYGGNMDSGIDTFGQMNFGWAQGGGNGGDGDAVSIHTTGKIQTSGSGAIGILAQSIGGGGAGRQHRHRVQLRTGHGHQQWPPLCRQRRGHGGER
jgi:hypothetical protein